MAVLANLRGELHRWLLRVNRAYFTTFYTKDYNQQGVDIFEEDWDNLVILDACRHDTLSDVDRLPGELQYRESRGSMTIEFLEANFADRDLTDTVYVTATPQVNRFQEELNVNFHETVDIWADDDNLWSTEDGRRGVLPETTAEYAMDAADSFPEKRILVHFTQPHLPFLNPGCSGFAKSGNLYREKIRGELGVAGSELRKAYRQNLEEALPHVRDLLRSLRGLTVVTSDHGELLGERIHPLPVRAWGHPHGIYVDELVRVPWLVYENGPRRDIVAEEPRSRPEEIDRRTVEERLRDLGYTE